MENRPIFPDLNGKVALIIRGLSGIRLDSARRSLFQRCLKKKSMDIKVLEGMKVNQIGIMVKEVEKAIEGYRRVIGSDNFKIFEYPDKSKKGKIYSKGNQRIFRSRLDLPILDMLKSI